jgi:hypothetical protein
MKELLQYNNLTGKVNSHGREIVGNSVISFCKQKKSFAGFNEMPPKPNFSFGFAFQGFRETRLIPSCWYGSACPVPLFRKAARSSSHFKTSNAGFAVRRQL